MIQGAALALLMTASAQVTLRGGESPPAGEVVAVDPSGVWLGPPAQAEEPPKTGVTTSQSKRSPGAGANAPVLGISWDRVKSINGPFKTPAEPLGSVAERAWRARTRLERGDFVSAEPLFETLFGDDKYREQTGPTAAVIAEGLLRCRLHRAAHIAAIEPWLTLLRANGTPTAPVLHANWAPEAGMPTILDATTGLSPSLPPIWLNWTAVDSFAKAGGTAPVQVKAGSPVDAKVQTMAALYAQSAKFEAGLDATLPEPASNDPGLALVWQIVAARIGNPDQRETARRQLSDRLRPPSSANAAATPAWQEAWCYAAIGRSLIREDSGELKRLGVIELLNVPARYGRVHPYLAGIALAESSATLRSLGDKAGADVLAAELFREYPTHPVLDWGPMRTFVPRSVAPPAPKPATGAVPQTDGTPKDAPPGATGTP
jgi:hypothetical protein